MRELAYKITNPEKKNAFEMVFTYDEANQAKNAGYIVKEILIETPDDVRIREPIYKTINGHLELNENENAGDFIKTA